MFRRPAVVSSIVVNVLLAQGCESDIDDAPVQERGPGDIEPLAVINPIVIDASVTTRHAPVWISMATGQMLDDSSPNATTANAVLWTPYTIEITAVHSGQARPGQVLDLWVGGGQKGDFFSGTGVMVDTLFGHQLLDQGSEYTLTLVPMLHPAPESGCVSCPTPTNPAFAIQTGAYGGQFPPPLDLTAAAGCQDWANIDTPFQAANWGEFLYRVPDVDHLTQPFDTIPVKSFRLDTSMGDPDNDCDPARAFADALFEWEAEVYFNNPATAWSRIKNDFIFETSCNIDNTDQINCVKLAPQGIPSYNPNAPCPQGKVCKPVARTGNNGGVWDPVAERFTFVDSDIYFNTLDWVFKWFPCHSADAPFNQNYDLTKISMHEIGHSWGLEHRQCTGDNIMRTEEPPLTFNPRAISEAEVQRIELLYPLLEDNRCPAWEWLVYWNCWCDVTGCVGS